jgi:hypothetical protein
MQSLNKRRIKMTNLKHSGILGMKWGVRRSNDGLNGIKESTISTAKKDAQRHVDAKMFYGKTAGTRRKLLKAEVDRKKKLIPDYEKAFDHLTKTVNSAKSAKKAISERTRIDTIAKGRSLAKKVLGITGSLAVGVTTMAYYANKQKVDAYVINTFDKLVKNLK